jgi:hypothetical protein
MPSSTVAASGCKNELTEATFTIAPDPCSSIGPSAARIARSPVKKFIRSAVSNSSALAARKPPTRNRTAPTLVTSTSSLPCSSMALCTSRAGASTASRFTGIVDSRSLGRYPLLPRRLMS